MRDHHFQILDSTSVDIAKKTAIVVDIIIADTGYFQIRNSLATTIIHTSESRCCTITDFVIAIPVVYRGKGNVLGLLETLPYGTCRYDEVFVVELGLRIDTVPEYDQIIEIIDGEGVGFCSDFRKLMGVEGHGAGFTFQRGHQLGPALLIDFHRAVHFGITIIGADPRNVGSATQIETRNRVLHGLRRRCRR